MVVPDRTILCETASTMLVILTRDARSLCDFWMHDPNSEDDGDVGIKIKGDPMDRTIDDLRIPSILLAEDSEDDRALAFRAMRKCGVPVAVQVATDGQRALSLLSDPKAVVPALVVLDVKMPRLSGIEVLGAIRDDARFDQVPVVMMTSSDEPTDIEVCRRLGADAYVRKPVDFEEYLGLVAEVAQFWLAHPRGSQGGPISLLDAMAAPRV